MSEQTLIPSYHPTYCFFRNPYEMGSFMVDLDRFTRLIKGGLEAPPKKLNISPSAHDVVAFHRWALRTGEPLSLDIETLPLGDQNHTAKDPLQAVLQLVGIGNTEEALCVHWGDGTTAVERALKKVLADKRVVKVLQNGDWYDLRCMPRYGLVTRNVEDTRDARRALSSSSPLNLEYQGSIHTDYHAWKRTEKTTGDEKGIVFTKKIKRKKRYNCHDCVVTARVWRGHTSEPEWRTPRVQQLYQHQRALSQVAARMHTKGVGLNKQTRAFMAYALEKEYDEKEKKFLQAVGIKGFKCTPNHLRALIYSSAATGKYAGLGRFNLGDPMDPSMYSTKEMTGLSVKSSALLLLLIDPSTPKELKEIINLYWDAEETWKKRSTFVVSKKIDNAIGPDGRLRASWNSCGTATGRFSCSNPNLMNIEDLIRAMYEAEEGWVLVGADYSQLELRVMAEVAEDDALREALRGDVYTVEAIDYFKLPVGTTKATIKKDARKAAKVIRLARQYGAGKKTVFRNCVEQDRSFTWDRVMPLMNAFDKRNHRTVAYWDEEMARVQKTGYSESRILNRRLVYPREPDRAAVANYPIQSTAADIKNLALIEVDKRLEREVPSARIVIDLHDAIYVEARERDAAKVERIVKGVMERGFRIDGVKDVHFPVKIETHRNWGDFS